MEFLTSDCLSKQFIEEESQRQKSKRQKNDKGKSLLDIILTAAIKPLIILFYLI